jgi:LuxR family maltose regulon positive regulatory protein
MPFTCNQVVAVHRASFDLGDIAAARTPVQIQWKRRVLYNGVMLTPVLATKLFIPPPRPNAVLRADLIARLNEGLHRRLTLISAPAGFGKTSLASAWIAGCGRPAAWLSLDDGDNDPARFLAYLVAALQTIAPTVGAEMVALLQSPQPPPIDALLPLLLNQIATLPQPAILVLDDYHVLEVRPSARRSPFWSSTYRRSCTW